MLFSAASLPPPARVGIPPRRRAPLRETHRSLFDLLLDDTYPWETLHEPHQHHAVQILARLIAQAVREEQEKEENHE
jgi:hypothetical protein